MVINIDDWLLFWFKQPKQQLLIARGNLEEDDDGTYHPFYSSSFCSSWSVSGVGVQLEMVNGLPFIFFLSSLSRH
jgi:hypothetical protein